MEQQISSRLVADQRPTDQMLNCPARIFSFYMKYYAVARGFRTGIFTNWAEVKPLVHGYNRAIYKSFKTQVEAQRFIHANSNGDSAKLMPPISKTSTVPKTSSSQATLLAMTLTRKTVPEHTPVDTLISKSINKPSLKSGLTQEVYCDGGARGNGSKNATAGYGVYFGKDSKNNYAVPFDEIETNLRPTNQTTELFAIRETLIAIYWIIQLEEQVAEKYVICTDSQFAINCITVWGEKWIKNGWKKANGESVIHKDIIYDCMKLIKFLKAFVPISFKHVRGHQGVFGNEMADALANIACDNHNPLN